MKIAIISDIHDNTTNLKKCFSVCKEEKIEHAICCGDVTNIETLDLICKKFGDKLFLVKGNAEIYNENDIKKYPKINYAGKIGYWTINDANLPVDKKIGACHEPYLIDKVLEKGKCDIVFYGHTHKPWEMNKKNTRIINPGTLSGMFTIATFAIWDTEKNNLQLKTLY